MTNNTIPTTYSMLAPPSWHLKLPRYLYSYYHFVLWLHTTQVLKHRYSAIVFGYLGPARRKVAWNQGGRSQTVRAALCCM
jgi:hypothetical protein